MTLSSDAVQPASAVPLHQAISALRAELTRAWYDGRDYDMRFELANIELSIEAAVTAHTTGSGGVHWWVLELGAEHAREQTTTQRLTLTINPRWIDEKGNVLPVRISAADDDVSSADSVERRGASD